MIVIVFRDGTTHELREREHVKREPGWLTIYTNELDMKYEPAGMAWERVIASFPTDQIAKVEHS